MMFSNNEIMSAVLALDVYNRGNNAKLDAQSIVSDLGNQIGLYKVQPNVVSKLGSDNGLSAAYYISLEKSEYNDVISYRGTDVNGNWGDTIQDGAHGFGLGAGFSEVASAQVREAMRFFEDVTDASQSYDHSNPIQNLTITGQSLGGGLAGFVAAVTGNKGILFQNMPYLLGAISSVKNNILHNNPDITHDELTLLQSNRLDSMKNITDYSIHGEVLEFLRTAGEDGVKSDYGYTPTYYFENTSGIPDSILTSFSSWFTPFSKGGWDLLWGPHSQALMTLYMFGHNYSAPWRDSAQFVMKNIFDDTIAVASGVSAYGGVGSPGGKLGSLIAYTVIPEGVKPFGDVAASALFNDMGDLNGILKAWGLPKGSFLEAHIDDVSKLIVTFSGRMAVGRVLAESSDTAAPDNENALDGVISIVRSTSFDPLTGAMKEEERAFTIDVSRSQWNRGVDFESGGTKSTGDKVVAPGLTGIHSYVLSEAAKTDSNIDGRLAEFGITPLDTFDYYTFVKGDPWSITSLSRHDGISAITVDSGGGYVFGSSGKEAIIGGDGEDVINGQGGHDILLGGEGNDALYGSPGDILMGGKGDDGISMYDSFNGDTASTFINGGDGVDLLSYIVSSEQAIVFTAKDGVFSGTVTLRGRTDTYVNVENLSYEGHGDAVFNGNGMMKLYGSAGDDRFNVKIGDTVYGGGGSDVVDFSRVIGGISMSAGGQVAGSAAPLDDYANGHISRISDVNAVIGTRLADLFDGRDFPSTSTPGVSEPVLFAGGGGADMFRMYDGNIATGGAGADKFYVNLSQSSTEVRITDLRAEDAIYINLAGQSVRLTGNEISVAFKTVGFSGGGGYSLYETTIGSSSFATPATDRLIGSYYSSTNSVSMLENGLGAPNASWLTGYDYMDYDVTSSTGVIHILTPGYGALAIVLDDIDLNNFGLNYSTIEGGVRGTRYDGQSFDRVNPLGSLDVPAPARPGDSDYAYVLSSSNAEEWGSHLQLPQIELPGAPQIKIVQESSGISFLDMGNALASDIAFSSDSSGSDLVITMDGEVVFAVERGLSGHMVDGAHFADGISLSYTDLWSMAVTPSPSLSTSHADGRLIGSLSADSFRIAHGGTSAVGFDGNDSFFVTGSGSNILDGGAGDDRFDIYGSGSAVQTVRGGSGNDTVYSIFTKPVNADLGDGNDFIQASSGNDSIDAGAGDDYVITGAGVDTLKGGKGRDDVEFYGQNGVIADLFQQTVTYASGDVREMSGFENIHGSMGTDTLRGDDGSNNLYGSDGDDVLNGRSGDDWLSGDHGNDVLYAGTGYDALSGGSGNDVLDGGENYDTAYFIGRNSADFLIQTADGRVSIHDTATAGNLGTDTLIGIESLSFADRFVSIASPIVLDMDGNGVRLIDLASSTVSFDFDGDGVADRTGWMSTGDGMLVLDANANGKVDGASEVSFTGRQGVLSDLDGLRDFDTNADGALSAEDAGFSAFGVWIDANGNGRSEGGELQSLLDLGITSIDLGGETLNRSWMVGENITVAHGVFQDATGQHLFSDVGFAYERSLPADRNVFANAEHSGKIVFNDTAYEPFDAASMLYSHTWSALAYDMMI